MEIEFENIAPNFEILEYTIREIDYDIDGERAAKYPHFQARIMAKDFDCDGNIDCVISYYDSNNRFLGLDEDTIWSHDVEEDNPIALSMLINIPEGAVRGVFRFNYNKRERGFYSWAGHIATFMGLMLLFSWLMNSFGFFK